MVRRASICAVALCLAVAAAAADRLGFPKTPKRPVVDQYFGISVRDEYQWLEDDRSPAVNTWAIKQDERTRRWLSFARQRSAIQDRLRTWNEQASPTYSRLASTAEGLFALTSAPGRQQSFLVRLASVDDASSAVVVVDPNVIDPSGATAIDWWVPSPSGRWIAVCLSTRGSEVGTLHFFNATNGAALPDRIPRVQFPTGGGSAVWSSDESSVYYTRYPAPEERPEADRKFFQQVFVHRLGTDSAQDVYSIGREFPRIAEIKLSATPEGLFVVATVSHGDGGDRSFYVLPDGGRWELVATPADGVKEAVPGDDGMLYLLTHDQAPRGRILRVPFEQPELAAAIEVVPQGDGVIRHFVVHGGRLYVSELVGGPSRLRECSAEGSTSRTIELPADAGIAALVARPNGALLINVTRYVEPAAWYEYIPNHSALRKTAFAATSPVDFSDVRVERLLARAADGVDIPITLLAPMNIVAGTAAPLLLNGYGAYGATNEPGFVADRRLWFDAGGVVAIAHVRGGGDFGATWHKAGNLAHKQTTFSDFVTCARHLIATGWTSADRLAIQGGSAGGLLMGAVLTQHPELFRAVVSRVGIYDALRSERWPNGEFNTTEFGTVQIREQFDALQAYSPYHHVVRGKKYPAILLTTGMHDGRVPPAHSFKMAARLQAATASKHPVLLRVDLASGHGRGSSRSARLDERVDVYAFLFAQLRMTVAPK